MVFRGLKKQLSKKFWHHYGDVQFQKVVNHWSRGGLGRAATRIQVAQPVDSAHVSIAITITTRCKPETCSNVPTDNVNINRNVAVFHPKVTGSILGSAMQFFSTIIIILGLG